MSTATYPLPLYAFMAWTKNILCLSFYQNYLQQYLTKGAENIFSFFLSFIFWSLLPIRRRCRGLLLHLITRNDTDIHTHTHTHSRLDSSGRGSARRRDLYLTTHNTLKRRTFTLPAGFEPAIPASEPPQTYALDRATTGTSFFRHSCCRIFPKLKFYWQREKTFLYFVENTDSYSVRKSRRVILCVMYSNIAILLWQTNWVSVSIWLSTAKRPTG